MSSANVKPCELADCCKKSSSYNLLQHFHWLPIKHRINFKIANITFRTLQSSQPVYLRSILHTHHSTRSLRLSNANLLCAPFVRTSFGFRSFSIAAPKIWNLLPPALRMCTSHDTFRHQTYWHCNIVFCIWRSIDITFVRPHNVLYLFNELAFTAVRSGATLVCVVCVLLSALDEWTTCVELWRMSIQQRQQQ